MTPNRRPSTPSPDRSASRISTSSYCRPRKTDRPLRRFVIIIPNGLGIRHPEGKPIVTGRLGGSGWTHDPILRLLRRYDARLSRDRRGTAFRPLTLPPRQT